MEAISINSKLDEHLMLKIFLALILTFSSIATESNIAKQSDLAQSFVVADVYGQMGNNLFQVAAASALAWDNNVEAYFPDLATKPTLYQHLFSRCKIYPPHNELSCEWREPDLAYHQIPFKPNMRMIGYFQSEKFFAHHRNRILDLFAPSIKDMKYMRKKYGWLIDHPNTVGVQIRYYFEDPIGEIFIQYGRDYLNKAMALFPEETLFVVSSNNIEFAKKNIPEWAKNVHFLEDEFYIDFYLLTFCKHNIISNSTFGWWSAWLNLNPNKIIVRPSLWLNGHPTQDVCPENWVKIDAKRGCVQDPTSY